MGQKWKRSLWDDLPEILKPAEAQAALRISRATFFRMIERGEMIGAIRVGGSWRVVRDKLRAWVESNAR